MKIIQVMPEFGLAGAEVMCETLTCELIRMGYDVEVISMYDYHSPITERMEAAGVQIHYLHKKPGLDLTMIPKMCSLFKNTGANAVHTHLYCVQYAIPAAVLAGVKHRVHTLHNIAQKETHQLGRTLNKFFFHYCHVIPVALSAAVQKTIVDEYKLPQERIPVIVNGADLSKCRVKSDYSIRGSFKILHIGRFSAQKNHKTLLQAFQLFHKKHENSELWLIGDGEERANAEAFVQENGLKDCIKFLGLQSNVYSFLHQADLSTLPSLYEGLPMTLIEAMGTALPIVATAVGGIPDMLRNEQDALLVDNDIQAIAGAFERYYLDITLREAHGRSAKKQSVAYSAHTMAEKYLEVYQL